MNSVNISISGIHIKMILRIIIIIIMIIILIIVFRIILGGGVSTKPYTICTPKRMHIHMRTLTLARTKVRQDCVI